ncbi:MAG: copper chaperone Copz family protein [Acidobacteria bacterium]|nr:copper chaperone Copz family protein [Acidobacteriota bacterium]
MSNCCSVPSSGKDHSSPCRVCGQKARRVARLTMEHLLKKPAFARLENHTYYFCATPACPIVYFTSETTSSYSREDVRVRVGLKETEDPVPICYCFGFTEKMVLDEIRDFGHSTIPDKIRMGVKAGNCSCEVKNPSGKCCLGVVTRVVLNSLNGRRRGMRTKINEPAPAPALERHSVTSR